MDRRAFMKRERFVQDWRATLCRSRLFAPVFDLKSTARSRFHGYDEA
jgi:hypothetical protein